MPRRGIDSFCTDGNDRSTLITGVTGFLGSNIARVMSRSAEPIVGIGRSTRVDGTTLPCDLHDHEAVLRVIERIRPARTIHAAWNVSPGTYLEDPDNDRWAESSLHLLARLIDSGCRHVIMLGTCLEHQLNVDSTCYARAKAKLREKAIRMTERTGVGFCWLRIFQPYGPQEHEDRLIPALVQAARNGEPFRLRAPHRVLDFIHVNDLASAIACASQREIVGTYDLGSGTGTSIRSVAHQIFSHFDCADLLRLDEAEAEQQSESLIAQIAPFARACNWQPSVSIEKGLRRTIDELEPQSSLASS